MYHAQLSPSSAARWINCPASVSLCKEIPGTTSEPAEAGRLAHSLAELKARKKFTPMSTRTYNSQLKKLQADSRYAREMDGYTDQYVDALTEHAMSFHSQPFTALETSVPVGSITGEQMEDGQPSIGTADCIQIAEGVLWVTDYKNGAGAPVNAKQNPQMMLYALGALELYHPIYGDSLETVRMTIVQPALNSITDWETTRGELEDWGRDVARPAANRAREGNCEPQSGEWCKTHFCPIRDTCRARANGYRALEAFGEKLPPLLTDNEVGEVLRRAKGLAAWVKSLEDYALKACLEGREIPGWKAVEGRSDRTFKDQDAALNTLLSNGYAREVIYDWVPKSLAQLQKLLGKKAFDDLLGEQVVKPAGKPKLAEESDKRPVYNAAEVAFGG